MPTIFLHPLPFDGSIWRQHLDSPGVDDDLVIAPDLYRLGDSIEAWAQAVLDLAGTGPLVLVGGSVGGSCAIEVARLAPERVALLVLVGAKAGHRPEPDLRDAAIRMLVEHGMEGAWETYWAPLFGPNVDPAVVADAYAIALTQRVEDVINGVRVFHGRTDRTEVVESLDTPIVVVTGDHDPTARHAPALAARVRHGSFHRIANCGHYVPLEQPEELAAILRDAPRRSR